MLLWLVGRGRCSYGWWEGGGICQVLQSVLLAVAILSGLLALPVVCMLSRLILGSRNTLTCFWVFSLEWSCYQICPWVWGALCAPRLCSVVGRGCLWLDLTMLPC